MRIQVKYFGRACGFAAALIYLGCAISMAFLGHDAVIIFANSFFHHLDVSSIIKDAPMGWVEILFGAVEFFIVGWLGGASIAAIYNYSIVHERKDFIVSHKKTSKLSSK
ncbi:MAG TPA: DUF5676 family membrane protein [Bacteroidia bacterium]|nr:DUF5676 family membrane protein [Bacteroidia bacterium]